MRIVMVNHYARPPRLQGGTRHHSLARTLVGAGHEVTLVASSFDHWERRRTVEHGPGVLRTEICDGVKLVWLRSPGYGGPMLRVVDMLAFAGLVTARGIPDRPDVVVGSSPHPFAALAGWGLARRAGCPFVYEIRDLWPQTLIDLGRVSPNAAVVRTFRAIERFLCERAARVVTLLPGSETYLMDRGVAESKIEWVPNGVDFSLLGPARPPNPDGGALRVGYAGAHALANCLDVLLDAADLLRDEPITFTLIGTGPMKRSLMDRARDRELSRVEFLDPVPKQEIYDRLADFDAFVALTDDSPLYRYGISLNKLYDYMGVGRPIVFSSGSPYDPVSLARCGVTVPPADPAALAEAFRRVASMSPEERAELGRAGRAYVLQHHDLAVLGARLAQILEAVVDEGRRRPSS
jgi:glycosyltransferase involved in cell wall biosynthesis